jgi:hypothetical protein
MIENIAEISNGIQEYVLSCIKTDRIKPDIVSQIALLL